MRLNATLYVKMSCAISVIYEVHNIQGILFPSYLSLKEEGRKIVIAANLDSVQNVFKRSVSFPNSIAVH